MGPASGKRGRHAAAACLLLLVCLASAACSEQAQDTARPSRSGPGTIARRPITRSAPRGPEEPPRDRADAPTAKRPARPSSAVPSADPAQGPAPALHADSPPRDSSAAPAPEYARPHVDRLVPIDSRTGPPVDPRRVAAAGIRTVEGKHLVLYTDVEADQAIDELPEVFERAVQQWCAYFCVDPSPFEQWRITGYLMGRKERFETAGLLPPDLPPFLNGYQRGAEIWVYEQPSPFYRRHLVLHEGTHAFMERQFGGAGPPWHMEGIAELLGTHRWEDGALQLAHFPTARRGGSLGADPDRTG